MKVSSAEMSEFEPQSAAPLLPSPEGDHGDLSAFRSTYGRFRTILLLLAVLAGIMAVHLTLRVLEGRSSVHDMIALGLLAAAFLVLSVGLVQCLATLTSLTARRLEQMAFLDGLTGVYNYRYTLHRLEQEVARSRRTGGTLSVVFMDLEDFKSLNDRYGHEMGNEALRAVSRRLRRHVRPYDLICRLGGDEFLAILPDTPEQEARAIAGRLVAAVGTLAVEGPNGIVVGGLGLSKGIAQFPGVATDADSLLREADRAMYRAKRGGDGSPVAGPSGSPPDGYASVAPGGVPGKEQR